MWGARVPVWDGLGAISEPKMDIEGHEVKVFEGGLDYFSKNSGNTKFLLEVHPHFYDGENDFEKIFWSIPESCRAFFNTT